MSACDTSGVKFGGVVDDGVDVLVKELDIHVEEWVGKWTSAVAVFVLVRHWRWQWAVIVRGPLRWWSKLEWVCVCLLVAKQTKPCDQRKRYIPKSLSAYTDQL